MPAAAQYVLLCDECKRPVPGHPIVRNVGTPPSYMEGKSYYHIGITQMFGSYSGKCPLCQGGDAPLKHVKVAKFESDLE